jgi:hypothetical protein
MADNNFENNITDAPIQLPRHPFWEVFRRFGRDETLALIINAISTFIVTLLLSSVKTIDVKIKGLIIALSGPVFEKIGFFPAHFWEAWKEYKTVGKKTNPGFRRFFIRALKNGFKSLIEDILIHDPIYMILVYTGILLYPQTPPWILSVSSFVIAVLIVSAIEVSYVELTYFLFKRSLCKIEFEVESYYETRFLISKEQNPKDLINHIIKEFDLPPCFERNYKDKYFDNSLKNYCSRTPQLLLRERTEKKGLIRSLQVVYNRAMEIEEKNLTQFRYFAIKKDKIYFELNEDLPESIDKINNNKVKDKLIKYLNNDRALNIDFKRLVSYNRKTLFISVDHLEKLMPYYVVELKVYKDKNLLKKAMRFIMQEFPVIQTTYRKFDLIGI